MSGENAPQQEREDRITKAEVAHVAEQYLDLFTSDPSDPDAVSDPETIMRVREYAAKLAEERRARSAGNAALGDIE